MKRTKVVLLVLCILLINSFAYTAVINVPGDQPTIQAGINAATSTDTVLVQPGTYLENINYNGKLITVGSLFLTTQDTTYIPQTIIDGNQLDHVVTFENGEDSTSVLSGFTIQNGYVSGDDYPERIGGGIYCNSSSPSLMNVTITNNYAREGGGVACYEDSNPSLMNVIINYHSDSTCW